MAKDPVHDFKRHPSVELDIGADAPKKQGFHVNYDEEPVLFVTIEFKDDGTLVWNVGTMNMDGRTGQTAQFVDEL